MISEELKQKGLKVVTYAMLLAESIDELRGTTLFSGKAKQYLNAIPNLLKKQININDDTHDADKTTYANIHINFDELVSKLAKKDVHDLVMINQIHDYYSKNPEDWKNLFEVEMIKIED